MGNQMHGIQNGNAGCALVVEKNRCYFLAAFSTTVGFQILCWQGFQIASPETLACITFQLTSSFFKHLIPVC
jgi:hypothetical protein